MKLVCLTVLLFSVAIADPSGSGESHETESDIKDTGIGEQLEQVGGNIAEEIRALISSLSERTVGEQKEENNTFQNSTGCGTKHACEDLGLEHNVVAGCLPKDTPCQGIRIPGRQFCDDSDTCACCVPIPEDQCDSGRRLDKVIETCDIILVSICDDKTENCQHLKKECIRYICQMVDITHDIPHYKKPDPFKLVNGVGLPFMNEAATSASGCNDDSSCDCNWSPGGCSINNAAPNGCACYCKYKMFWSCVGKVVPCKDSNSEWCKNPSSNVESCKQGNGDCDGYT